MENVYTVDIKGLKVDLPILSISDTVSIAFINLHGNAPLTEHCGKELAKLVKGCDVLLTAESKGLQLTHVIARELDMPFYAVARKSKKLYMQDGISVEYGNSITTGVSQKFYLSKHDVDLIKGKSVCIIDDVVSTGESLKGLRSLVEKAGGRVINSAFVLAEGDAKNMEGVTYLATIPLFFK